MYKTVKLFQDVNGKNYTDNKKATEANLDVVREFLENKLAE